MDCLDRQDPLSENQNYTQTSLVVRILVATGDRLVPSMWLALTALLVVALTSARSVLCFTAPDPPPQNLNADSNCSNNQLTWREVGQMLVNKRDKDGVSADVLMSTRLTLRNLSRVRLGPSTIPNAGRGLFATMDCAKGDLLTCYPGDVLLHKSGLRNVPDELEADEDKLRSYLADYCIGVTDEYGILGLPERDQDMAYVGHFANDGIAFPPETEEELEIYVVKSQEISNARILPLEYLHMVLLAERDIKKDEEIFVFYGPVYWMEHPNYRGPKPT